MSNETTSKDFFQGSLSSLHDIPAGYQENLNTFSSGSVSLTPFNNNKLSDEKVRIVRKLEGFLVAFEGDEAVVCFIKNEECIEMVVPAKNLKMNNITEEDQPFEYIESEIFKNGYWRQSAAYKPLCHADEYTRTSVKLSDESRKQLAELLPLSK